MILNPALNNILNLILPWPVLLIRLTLKNLKLFHRKINCHSQKLSHNT